MATRTRKLPRGPHAPKVRPDEVVRKKGGADLQNGWLSRHGDLKLTDDRLLFDPTILDKVMGAKRREISLDDIEELERWPRNPEDFPPGGRRARLLVQTREVTYEFMVGDLDAWIDAMVRVYELRGKAGRPYAPAVLREGYVNMLYAADE
jgi:hypothetical protein